MDSKTPKSSKGFTLIELLIVVAIIAILAAIAVPNFLEAQIRSKTSRVKTDMRSLATAMEAYSMDNNGKYPPEYLNKGYAEVTRIFKAESHLTTPIAFISSVPLDPFNTASNPAWQPGVYWYYNWLQRMGYLLNVHKYYGGNPPCPWYNEPAAWCLTSLGPNRKPEFPKIYDPTNGTVSDGDITRLGPGGGGSR